MSLSTFVRALRGFRRRTRRVAPAALGGVSVALLAIGCGATTADPIDDRTGKSGLSAGQPMHPKLAAATQLEIHVTAAPGGEAERRTITDPALVAEFAAVIDATSNQPAATIPRGQETAWLSFTDAANTQLLTVHIYGDTGYVRDPDTRSASPAEIANVQALLDAHVRN